MTDKQLRIGQFLKLFRDSVAQNPTLELNYNMVYTKLTGLGIPGSDTTYSVATTSANGLMSSTDKSKLDGIAAGANKTTVDSSIELPLIL